MARRHTDTIPKLDQLSYLFDTLGAIEDHLSFDAIRKELIRLRPESRGELKRLTSSTFWSNARDAIRELMRLGFVDRASLPSRLSQLDSHRARTFALTSEGKDFLALERTDPLQFRHRFAQAMLVAHPYMRELLNRLATRELFFPRIQRSDLPGEIESWLEAPPEPLGDITAWITQSVNGVMQTDVNAKWLESTMRPFLTAAWRRLDREQKSHLFNKAVVKSFNDVIVRVLLQAYGLRMDYVTFRSAISLLSELSALWDTRSLIERRGWTVWTTSVAEAPVVAEAKSPAGLALRGPLWFKPRLRPETEIKEKLISTFLSFSGRRGGFALIHVLRAEVCHMLGIHGRDFDAVLRKLHNQTLVDPTYAVNLDRGGADEVPPSEEPFRIGKRAFYLITLIKRHEEESIDGAS